MRRTPCLRSAESGSISPFWTRWRRPIAWPSRCERGGWAAPSLYRLQIGAAHPPPPQRDGQAIGRRHRVLNGDIDPDSADRRHGVRRIADQEQARPPPLPQKIDRYGQELHIVEAAHL